MRFDPFSWEELQVSTPYDEKRGRLKLRVSAPSALYVQALGVETLFGYGADFDVTCAHPFSFKVEGPKGARAFAYSPADNHYTSTAEVYTNGDRLPMESGTMAEVRREIRLHRLHQMQERNELRMQLNEVKQLRASLQEAPKSPPEAPTPPPPATPLPETDKATPEPKTAGSDAKA